MQKVLKNQNILRIFRIYGNKSISNLLNFLLNNDRNG